jgi:hypothetical protein
MFFDYLLNIFDIFISDRDFALFNNSVSFIFLFRGLSSNIHGIQDELTSSKLLMLSSINN